MRLALTGTAITTIVLALPSPSAAAAPANPCVLGNAYLQASNLDKAQAQFEKPKAITRPCARRGLEAIARERIRQSNVAARSLRAAGFTANAQEEIKQAILKNPETAVADDLTSLLQGRQPFAVALALRQAGLDLAAGEAVQAAIKDNPGLPVPAELRGRPRAERHIAAARELKEIGLDEASQKEVELAVLADPGVSTPDELKQQNRDLSNWAAFKSDVGPRVRAVLEILALLVLLAAALNLVLQGIRRMKLRLTISDFEGGPEKLGSTLSVAVQDHVNRISSGYGGVRLYRVNTTGEAVSVPTAVTDAFPQAALAGGIATLVGRIFPARRRVLSGTVREYDVNKGAGLTLTLAKGGGKVVEGTTIWQNEFEPGPRGEDADLEQAYYRLSLPAAVWTLFAVQRGRWVAGREWTLRDERGSLSLRIGRKFNVLGTDDWMSYALFATGVAWEERDKTDKDGQAQRSYWMSIEQDGENQGARFNLATCWLGHLTKNSSEAGVEDSLGWLDRIREQETSSQQDPMWYRAAYVSAAARLRWIETKEHDPDYKQRQLRQGLRRAVEATWDVESRLHDIKGRVPRRRKVRALREFLLKNEAGTIALLASLLLETGIEGNGAPGPTTRVDLAKKLGACHEAWKDQGKDSNELPTACQTLSHAQLVQFAEDATLEDGTKVIINGRGHFNLACYYSRRGNLDRALQELERALNLRPDVFAPAGDDPGLRKVRLETSREFEEILDAHKPRTAEGNGPVKREYPVIEAVLRAAPRD